MSDSADQPRRIVASIVVGAGSARLLVARVDDRTSEPIARSSATTRLGSSLGADGGLSDQALRLTEEAVLVMSREARSIGAERMIVACTDAVGAAPNADLLLQLLERATGIRPRVLSTDEHTLLSFRGLASAGFSDRLVAADLGLDALTVMGGADGDLEWATTTDLGTERMIERYEPSDPPTLDVLGPMMAFARQTLQPVATANPSDAVVLTGGTAIAVATLADSEQLTRDRLVGVVERLAGGTSEDIAADSGLEQFRVRGCFPAAAILESLRREYGVEALEVSEVGLREGLVLESMD